MVCKSLYFQGFRALSASFWSNLRFTYYVIKNIFLLIIVRKKLISNSKIHMSIGSGQMCFLVFFMTWYVIR